MKKLFVIYVVLTALLVVRFNEETTPFYCSTPIVEIDEGQEEMR